MWDVFGHCTSSLNSLLCIWVFISIYVLSVAMKGMFFNPLCQDKSFQLKAITHAAQHQAPVKSLLVSVVQKDPDESFHIPFPVSCTWAQSQAVRGPLPTKNLTHFPELITPKCHFLKRGQREQSMDQTRAKSSFLIPCHFFLLQCI